MIDPFFAVRSEGRQDGPGAVGCCMGSSTNAVLDEGQVNMADDVAKAIAHSGVPGGSAVSVVHQRQAAPLVTFFPTVVPTIA